MPYLLRDTYGQEFPVTGVIQIGRDPACQILLSDPQSSRRHACQLILYPARWSRAVTSDEKRWMYSWIKESIALAGSRIRGVKSMA